MVENTGNNKVGKLFGIYMTDGNGLIFLKYLMNMIMTINRCFNRKMGKDLKLKIH